MSEKEEKYLGEEKISDLLTDILCCIYNVIADTPLELGADLPFTAQLVKNSDAEGFFWPSTPDSQSLQPPKLSQLIFIISVDLSRRGVLPNTEITKLRPTRVDIRGES